MIGASEKEWKRGTSFSLWITFPFTFAISERKEKEKIAKDRKVIPDPLVESLSFGFEARATV